MKFKDNSWTAEDVKWTELKTTDFDANSGIVLENNELELKDDQYHRWGATFYAIADASFVPIIAVTYDVILKDEKGETVTRKDVTSTITLGKAFFESLDPGKTATIYPINIFIQPRYLYVLADQDAYTGHLLIQ